MFANLDHDLLAEAKAGSVAEKTYSFQKKETQFVPVGAKTGVAAFNGWSVCCQVPFTLFASSRVFANNI